VLVHPLREGLAERDEGQARGHEGGQRRRQERDLPRPPLHSVY
jgi:hypothetical protein